MSSHLVERYACSLTTPITVNKKMPWTSHVTLPSQIERFYPTILISNVGNYGWIFIVQLTINDTPCFCGPANDAAEFSTSAGPWRLPVAIGGQIIHMCGYAEASKPSHPSWAPGPIYHFSLSLVGDYIPAKGIES